MKSSHVYINPQGVPCAPIYEFPLGFDVQIRETMKENSEWTRYIFSKISKTAIPIREEDERYAFQLLMAQPSYTGSFNNDTFYPVEPYEFEISVDEYHPFPLKTAYIIHPSEPKNFFDVYPKGIIGERDPLTPEDEAKRQAEWRKNFIAIQNQLMADGAFDVDWNEKFNAIAACSKSQALTSNDIPKGGPYTPEPKADPKEKELYSIKHLDGTKWINLTPKELEDLSNAVQTEICVNEQNENHPIILDRIKRLNELLNKIKKLCLTKR